MNSKNLCILSLCMLVISCSFAADASNQQPAVAPVVLQAEHGIAGYNMLSEKVKGKLSQTTWLKRPTWQTAVKAALWVGGPVALSIYLNTILKKDKKARQLKLKKQQPQDAGNPMAQLMMMMQMQQGGQSPFGGSPFGDDMPEGGMIDAMKQQEPVEITYNENDILSPRRRKFFEVLLFMSRALAIIGIVNAVDVAKDFWKGNTMPGAVRAHVNASIEFEKNKAQAIQKSSSFQNEEIRAEYTAKLLKHNVVSLKARDAALTQAKKAAGGNRVSAENVVAITAIGNALENNAINAVAGAQKHAKESFFSKTINTVGLPVLANIGISASGLVED